MQPKVALACAVIFASASAPAADIGAYVRVQLDMEQQLLTEVLESYRSSRATQDQQRRRATQLAQRVDQALEAGNIPADELQSLAQALSVAEAAAGATAARSGELRREVLQHLRHIELLRSLLSGVELERSKDPISGPWIVRVLPYDQRGIFDLRLEGTLVQGSYRLDGGFAGSLRGTFVRGVLRLERIDAEQGFDVVYEAELDPGGHRLSGYWTGTLLTAPGPTGGDWYAERAGTPEAQ